MFCFHKYFDVTFIFTGKMFEYIYENSFSDSTIIYLQNAIRFRLKTKRGNAFSVSKIHFFNCYIETTKRSAC